MTQNVDILLVEDDDVDAERIKRLLQKTDIPCIIRRAFDGIGAVEVLATHPHPELILLDLRLPRMDGFAFLDWAEANGMSKEIPVIVLTTSREEKERDRALNHGAAAFISKSEMQSGLPALGDIIQNLIDARSPAGGLGERDTMNCLVVEDDEIYREKVTRCVGGEFNLVFAVDLKEAITKLQEEEFDCALVDHRLPIGNGLAVLEKLVRRNVPTVYVTAQGSEEIAVAALKLGAEDYVIKGSAQYDDISVPLKQAVEQAKLREEHLTRDRAKDEVIEELRQALRQVEILEGLLPICSWCKSVRDDNGYWKSLETYLTTNTRMQITHGVCPKCLEKEVAEMKNR